MVKLPASFYDRPRVVTIARGLLGKVLVTEFGGRLTSGRIVEVEAYNGIVDRASHAPNLASTLNQGAFNLGNATGAWLGGMAIGAGAPLTTLPWVGVATSIGALALTLWSVSIERRAQRMAVAG